MDEIEQPGQEKSESASSEAMLEMIIMKEEEVRKRIENAEKESELMVEEAKLDAARVRREASSVEVGSDIREEEMEKAQREAGEIAAKAAAEAEQVKAKGMEHVEEAVGIVIEGVLPEL